jgi:hypothetical protein
MIRFASVLLLFLALSPLAIVGARRVGKSTPRPETYLEVGDCAQPCWDGLQPGISPFPEFWAHLDAVIARGGWMYSGSVVSDAEDILTEIILTINPTSQIRLGDLLLLYGTPDAGIVSQAATLGAVAPRRPYSLVTVYWLDGYLSATVIAPDYVEAEHLRPEMWVREVSMRDLEYPQPRTDLTNLPIWRGMGNMLSYQVR